MKPPFWPLRQLISFLNYHMHYVQEWNICLHNKYDSPQPQKLYKNYKDALRGIHPKRYDYVSAEIMDVTTGEVHYILHKEGGIVKDEFRNDPHPGYTTSK